jgi:hypothetical protein
MGSKFLLIELTDQRHILMVHGFPPSSFNKSLGNSQIYDVHKNFTFLCIPLGRIIVMGMTSNILLSKFLFLDPMTNFCNSWRRGCLFLFFFVCLFFE